MTATNYAVAPGAYLEEWLDDERLTQQRVAVLLGISRKHVNEIVNGHATLSPDLAVKLERVTGIPTDAWLRYEALYRADLARIAAEQSLAKHAQEIHPAAAKYLRQLGVTEATMRNPGRLVSDFLAFHRCGTWETYELLHTETTTGEYALAALAESRSVADTTLLTSWLRAGELTEAFELGREFTFDPSRLVALLPQLRERAAMPDSMMLKDLGTMLAEAGVVLIAVEPPAKLPLFGITRWIDAKVPVIQQSGRRGKDGFVIWTLFHEIGHVLNDPRGEMHLEYSTQKKRTTAAEKAANDFALKTLFGSHKLETLRELRSDRDIVLAARQIGVSPGVVVHQMHRRHMLDYAYGNTLFVELSDSFNS